MTQTALGWIMLGVATFSVSFLWIISTARWQDRHPHWYIPTVEARSQAGFWDYYRHMLYEAGGSPPWPNLRELVQLLLIFACTLVFPFVALIATWQCRRKDQQTAATYRDYVRDRQSERDHDNTAP